MEEDEADPVPCITRAHFEEVCCCRRLVVCCSPAQHVGCVPVLAAITPCVLLRLFQQKPLASVGSAELLLLAS